MGEAKAVARKRGVDMLEGNLLSNIVRFAIPVILTDLLQTLYNAADVVVLGQFEGETALGAVGATGNLVNLLVNFFIGMSIGASIRLAFYLGAKQWDNAHETVHTSMLLSVIIGVAVGAVGVGFSHVFLGWMGTPDTLIAGATLYMRIYFAGLPFLMVSNFAAAIIRTAGDSKYPLLVFALSGAVNVVLNLVLVIVFHMGVAGVAVGTVASQLVSSVLLVWHLMRLPEEDPCRLYIRRLRIYPQKLWQLIKTGLPTGIQSSLFSISNVMNQSAINSLGDVVVAGNTAAGNVEGFLYLSMKGFAATGETFIARNMGAGRLRRVPRILLRCLLLAAGAGLVFGLTAFLLSEQLISLYLPDAPASLAVGVRRLSLLAIPYLLCGVMDCLSSAVKGMGYTPVSMVVSLVGACGLRILWLQVMFFTLFPGMVEMIYLGYPVTWIIPAVGHLCCFLVLYRRLVKRSTKSPQYT